MVTGIPTIWYVHCAYGEPNLVVTDAGRFATMRCIPHSLEILSVAVSPTPSMPETSYTHSLRGYMRVWD